MLIMNVKINYHHGSTMAHADNRFEILDAKLGARCQDPKSVRYRIRCGKIIDYTLWKKSLSKFSNHFSTDNKFFRNLPTLYIRYFLLSFILFSPFILLAINEIYKIFRENCGRKIWFFLKLLISFTNYWDISL